MMKLFRMSKGITIAADTEKDELYIRIDATITRGESEEFCEITAAAVNWLYEERKKAEDRKRRKVEEEKVALKQNTGKSGAGFHLWGGA